MTASSTATTPAPRASTPRRKPVLPSIPSILPARGNRHRAGNTKTDRETPRIILDPKEPTLWTNRAMARLKLALHPSVVSDCHAALALSPGNMKAHYYLAQAHLALRDYEAAHDAVLEARRLCAATDDRSISSVTEKVLEIKKARWQERERLRVREEADLERELLAGLRRGMDDALRDVEAEGHVAASEVRAEHEGKMARLRAMFERARAVDDRDREPPSWATDDITYNFMIDPVMTKTGKSYERATLVDHIRRKGVDPMTREPLTLEELRPNLALRLACEEFLEKNGWAADW